MTDASEKKAAWGERRRWGALRKAESAGRGSCSKTSSPAPDRWPRVNASIKATSFT
ncbi:hypothetical protein YPPY65_1573, partial [Yersinia pestis PY-65]